MNIQDFAVVIILFIFADIVFYMVIMKGLLFASITGRTPEEIARRASEARPALALALHHTPTATPGQFRTGTRSAGVRGHRGNLAQEGLIDFTALVRHELRNLEMGNIRFESPEDVRVGEPVRLEMMVTQNIVESITKALNDAPHSKITTLRIGACISVSLQADCFTVIPLSPPEQRLAPGVTLHWAWEATPLKKGMHALGLDIALQLNAAGSEERRTSTWRDGHIEVAGNLYFVIKTFLRQRWKAALPASLAVLAGASYAAWHYYWH